MLTPTDIFQYPQIWLASKTFQAAFVHALPQVACGRPGNSLIATRTSVLVNVAFSLRLSNEVGSRKGVFNSFQTLMDLNLRLSLQFRFSIVKLDHISVKLDRPPPISMYFVALTDGNPVALVDAGFVRGFF
jgi:hypothetical protein